MKSGRDLAREFYRLDTEGAADFFNELAQIEEQTGSNSLQRVLSQAFQDGPLSSEGRGVIRAIEGVAQRHWRKEGGS